MFFSKASGLLKTVGLDRTSVRVISRQWLTPTARLLNLGMTSAESQCRILTSPLVRIICTCAAGLEGGEVGECLPVCPPLIADGSPPAVILKNTPECPGFNDPEYDRRFGGPPCLINTNHPMYAKKEKRRKGKHVNGERK